jgi:hypothetical protein
MRRILGLAVLCLCIGLAEPPVAAARGSETVAYRFSRVWSAVVRLVRVDYRFPVRDQDADVGYLLFDYQEDRRSHPGSFELVRVREHGRNQVRIVLSIPAMPSYIERMMLDKLLAKLEDDFGAPPPRRPDRGDDDEADDDDRKDDEDDDRDKDGRERDGSPDV